MDNKIILINKEKGISSYKKIREVQKKYNYSKIGHAGTLDPMAEGLVIAMSDNATKLSDMLMKKDKIYQVEMCLYYQTDTLDLEGNIVYIDEEKKIYKEKEIIDAISSFIGTSMQKPPMYSAIKLNGLKMYELARKNIEVDIPDRQVNIYYINNIKITGDKISFETKVSSGTYIRSLVRDIGLKLGTYATMTKLVRTQIDNFKLPEDIEIMEVDDAINLDKFILDYKQYFAIKNGMTYIITSDLYSKDMKLNAYYDDKYVGIIEVCDKKNNNIYIKRTKFFD